MTQQVYYEIRVKGLLDSHWSDRLGGLQITKEAETTLISGYIADQSALHGLLTQIRDAGLTLISISQAERKKPDESEYTDT